MGHSSRSSSISQSYSEGDESLNENQLKEFTDSIKSKDAVKTVDAFCSTTLPLMPDNSAKLPVYYGIKYGGMFLYHAHESDIETATKKVSSSILTTQLHSIGSDIVTDKVSEEVFNYAENHDYSVNKCTERFVEQSLNTTISSIMSKGSEAL